jgi:hypothetical protein
MGMIEKNVLDTTLIVIDDYKHIPRLIKWYWKLKTFSFQVV